MARAKMVVDAARQCAASSATLRLGWRFSDGQVVKLDDEGNAKASEALKAVNVETGKGVKAKVTGLLESSDTMKVASVEVKSQALISDSRSQAR